ncbi:MAG: DUF3618 domain-containing protein [Candidatus Baltobacteraceae bacterium]
MGKDPDQIRREIEDTRDRMGDTVDALAYKADVPNRVKDSITDRVDGVKSAIGNTATKVTSAVTGTTAKVGHTVGETTGDARDGAVRTVGMIKENPLGVLLSGVAVGFVLGSLLPATELENERIGELSDNLKSQAQDAGSQALKHGKAVLRETAEAAKESAQEHGQQLADQAKDQLGQNDGLSSSSATSYSTSYTSGS